MERNEKRGKTQHCNRERGKKRENGVDGRWCRRFGRRTVEKSLDSCEREASA